MPISAGEPLLRCRAAGRLRQDRACCTASPCASRPGEVVALLGPNGAGKTTLLRRHVRPAAGDRGQAAFDGAGHARRRRAKRRAPAWCMSIEGHRVFTQISVADNLLLAGYDLPRRRAGAADRGGAGILPEIAAKRDDRGGALSGGQQQMLAVAQGLVRRPRLLMLDEPSAGLSPVLVDRVLGVVSALRAKGTSVLLVEQLIEKALAVSDRVYAMVQGNIALEARADEPHLPHRLEQTYFGGKSPMHVHA